MNPKRAREKAPGGPRPEREIKFSIDPENFEAAWAHPLLGGPRPKSTQRRLLTTYFDTDAGDLSRNRMSLRIRTSGGARTMALKRSGEAGQEPFEREEEEVRARSSVPDLDLFDQATARDVRDVVDRRQVKPVFASDVRRSSRILECAGSTVEVALDSGDLIAVDRRAPIREIELELKAGDVSTLYRLGLSVVDALPVRLEIRSKAQRAAEILTGEKLQPSRAAAPSIAKDETLDVAIGVVLRNCLAHFLGNFAANDEGDAVEAVHQMRIAMRRLRAAIGLFRRAFPCPEFDALRTEAKAIAAALGEARDWDVLIQFARSGPFPRLGASPAFEANLSVAKTRADAGHAAASALIKASSTARFALSLEEFVARRGWRSGVPEGRSGWLESPVAAFAIQGLERLDRKLRKTERGFASLGPQERHRLRIELKRLRYANDFFRGIFTDSPEVREYARKVADLQDQLGQFNDAAIAARLIRQLDVGTHPELAYGVGVIEGWCARDSAGDEKALRAAWRAFAKSDRYWRDDARPLRSGSSPDFFKSQ